MSDGVTLRIADPADAEAILRIYTPHVEHAAVSFETEVPSIETIAQRIRERLPTHPWLVAVEDRQVVGYSYASPHRVRAAYDWSCEVTAYVAANAQGRGIGKRLYAALCTLLKRQRYVNAFGIITLPNPSSIALHEACGFHHAATFMHAGYKLGAWHDAGWWQLELQPPPPAPQPPIAFADLPADCVNQMLDAAFALASEDRSRR
jgi:L-amino acid N-acyltransferase YncA